MVYKIDNRPKRHQGRILALGIIVGVIITIGGFYWFENTPNLIKMAGQVSTNVTNQVRNISILQTQKQNTDLHALAMKIHDSINRQRISYNLPHLDWSESISLVATEHSKDMALNNYFDHIDLSGKNPIQRLSDNGINCNNYVGENIAAPEGYSASEIPDAVVNAWMNDEGHKANIINSGFTQEGIGLYQVGNQIYITEDFCSSSS